jgi:putative transcriptional regulator
MGVILNRPQGTRLPDLDAALRESIPEGLGKVPFFEGGPVGKQQLILARMIVAESSSSFEALHAAETDALPAKHPPGELRAFVGHAGWSEGQLEREIAEKSWIILPPAPELLTAAASAREGEDLWRRVMKSLGPWYHLTALAPDDLSLN